MKFTHFNLSSSPSGNWAVYAGNSPEECDEAEALGKVYLQVDGSLTAGEVCHYIDLSKSIESN